MADLIRDWVLDPVALLFYSSLITIAFVSCRRSDGDARSRHGIWRTLLVCAWFAVFLRNEPSLRLIAAGGVLRKASEAAVMANYLIAMGIDPQRIIKEAESRTTRENAENVALLLADQQVQSPVWLVTSALHMPRAVATFRQLLEPMGMHVCPVSVDKLALSNVPWWALIPQTTVIVKFDKWLHEILALGFYRLRGWI